MSQRIRPNVEKMRGYVPGEQPVDPTIVKLNTNENPYPPAPAALALLREPSEKWLRLYPDPVHTKLREAIGQVHGCKPEQVFCGNGSDEVLALCIRAFVPDHGRIGYFDPSYSLYSILADIADVGVAPIPLNADFSWPAISANYDVPLFFWTNPNAPTSLRCPAGPIDAFAARSEGVVVIDEAYVDFADANCLALALAHPNVLVTRTFSKSYSLAGIRLGYAVGNTELIAALYKIKDAYNLNRLTQEIGVAAVLDQTHMRENAKRIISTRERVARDLRARSYQVYPSQTNFLWVRPARIAAADLYRHLKEQGVYVRYFSSLATSDYLRITVGTDTQMDRFLSALPS